MTADERPEAPPHDREAKEPLGPMTPDEETPAGDTPEAHDEVTPHDLPQDHPGRDAAEQRAGDDAGTTRGEA
ncbi:MAG TPA: hypothetical protein VG474_01360 [Solirubrobacteraceae bacterium]|nr:hypothetical protein [Solirubrobacteraceae bacterium]